MPKMIKRSIWIKKIRLSFWLYLQWNTVSVRLFTTLNWDKVTEAQKAKMTSLCWRVNLSLFFASEWFKKTLCMTLNFTWRSLFLNVLVVPSTPAAICHLFCNLRSSYGWRVTFRSWTSFQSVESCFYPLPVCNLAPVLSACDLVLLHCYIFYFEAASNLTHTVTFCQKSQSYTPLYFTQTL